MAACLQFLSTYIITPLFNFSLPWGITFGSVLVGLFGAPLLVRAFKRIL